MGDVLRLHPIRLIVPALSDCNLPPRFLFPEFLHGLVHEGDDPFHVAADDLHRHVLDQRFEVFLRLLAFGDLSFQPDPRLVFLFQHFLAQPAGLLAFAGVHHPRNDGPEEQPADPRPGRDGDRRVGVPRQLHRHRGEGGRGVVQVAVDELHRQRPCSRFLLREAALENRRGGGRFPVGRQLLAAALALVKLPAVLALLRCGDEVDRPELEGNTLIGRDLGQVREVCVVPVGGHHHFR